MSKSPINQNPPVILDATFVERLLGLAAAIADSAPDVSDRLNEEIDRAKIVPSHKMPANVVTIGSTVTYRDNRTGRDQTITLVLPQDADIAQQRASVVTPIGAALIGLAEGASIHWATRTGEVRELTVLAVAQNFSPG